MDETITDTLARLSDATLQDLPDTVLRPRYDRSRLVPGIVHIGVGNFHRAHQAWFLHRLMQRGVALDWAIIGGGVRPCDAQARERLLAQDCLTTLIGLDGNTTSAEVTGAMIDYAPVQEDHGPLIDAMCTPTVRIVSLTLSEGGYFLHADGGFDADHPDMQHDATNPETPRTAFGAIIKALNLRKAAGQAAFTLLSCDNLHNNGDTLRRTLTGLADMSDPDLADWIAGSVSFPNSVVDCIVPETEAPEVAIARRAGIADAAPVTHEMYRRWVLEDSFPTGRPAWEAAGAIFTDRISDYAQLKLRILNGGQLILAGAGELLGVATVSDCMADADISAFFRKVQSDEVLPHVRGVPESTPSEYLTSVEQRLSNPAIRDTTRSIADHGSSRHPHFMLPILRDALAAGSPIRGLMLVQAMWARMCTGKRDDGSTLNFNDPKYADLHAYAVKARSDPKQWLYQRHIYGDLISDPRVVSAFCASMKELQETGTRRTLQRFLTP